MQAVGYESPARQSRPKRRASRACEYCRKKRLKCTPDQRPCFNCQLYGEECVHTERKKRMRRQQNTRTESPQTAQPATAEPALHSQVPRDSLASGSDIAADSSIQSQLTPVAMVTPDATRTLSPSNSNSQSSQWYLNPLGGTDFRVEQPPLGLNAAQQVPPEYAALLEQGLDMEVPMDYWDLEAHFNPTLPPLPIGTETNIFGLQQPSPPSRLEPSAGLFGLFGDPDESPAQPRIPLGLFIGKDLRANSFIGLHSAGSTLAVCLKDCLAASATFGKLDHIRFLFDAGPHINTSDVPGARRDLVAELPDQQLADFGIKAYFENIHPIYPIIDREVFLNNWPSLYSMPSGELDPITYSAVVLVVTTGILSDHSGRGVADLEDAVLKLYWQTWSLIDNVLGSPFLQSVQVLVLNVILQIQLGKESFAWVLCGLAGRMAQSLGLHRRSPTRFNLSDHEILLRSHLWWVIFSLDAYLSSIECRPVSARRNMCDHDPFPLGVGDLPLNADLRTLANIFHWNLRLSQIRHDYCVAVHRYETVRARLDSLVALDRSLVQWCAEVPMDIRPGQEILAPTSIHRFIGLLHLEYFAIVCAIHWASMLSTSQNPEIRASHESIRIQGSENMCVSAARSFIDVLNSIANQHEEGRIFPMSLHSHNCITMLSVLYRNIMMHPRRITAKGDFEYFRAGKLHLERQMHPSKLSPELTTLFDEMLRSAEELLVGS